MYGGVGGQTGAGAPAAAAAGRTCGGRGAGGTALDVSRLLGSPLALILTPYVRNDTSSGGRRVGMTAERAQRAWWFGVWAAWGVLI